MFYPSNFNSHLACAFDTLPVATDDDELLASAMAVTLNGWDWVWPDNTRVTTSDPLDSDTDKVEELNSTVVTIWEIRNILNITILKF